jgi:hypothetical protein
MKKYKLNRIENNQLGQLIREVESHDPKEAVKIALNYFPFNKQITDKDIEVKPINDTTYEVFIGEDEYLLSEKE